MVLTVSRVTALLELTGCTDYESKGISVRHIVFPDEWT
jgi:hypothetical protein